MLRLAMIQRESDEVVPASSPTRDGFVNELCESLPGHFPNVSDVLMSYLRIVHDTLVV